MPAPVEQELRTTEAVFAAILSIAADAIITIDESQRIQHFNRGAEQIFGYTADEAIGQRLDILIPERFRGSHFGHVMGFGRGPDTARRMGERGEIYGLRRNGDEFPAEASISKLSTSSGWLFAVVLRDITGRKRSEEDQRFIAEAGQRLAHSLDYEETLRTIAGLGVPHIADWTVLVVYGDEGAARVVSDHPDPEISAFLARLARPRARLWSHHGTDEDGVAGTLDQLVPEVTDAFIEANAIHRDDIELLEAQHIASLIVVRLTARGRVMGSATFASLDPARRYDERDFAVARAIAVRAALAADNARLYRTSQRLTRLRDEILSVVSHDLRNPLSAIAMCTRVLAESPPSEEPARRELLTAIEDSTEWMNRLIQDLLDVGNIEAGRLSLERRPTRVGDVLEQAEAMFATMTAEKGIALELDAPLPLPPVDADAERVLQVLANLIGNALKFTPSGGTITVGARPSGDRVEIFVADSGAGMPAEHVPFIFDRWWHARRSGSNAGTGLGLAIAKGIVEAHGGEIGVASVEGQGSTFTFTLPVAREAAAGGG
jgi:PAS domain S-box-containing protein